MLTRSTLIYIAQRLMLIVLTVMIISFGLFYAVHSLPGDAFISQHLNGQALQDLLHQYGLDRPIVVQYWDFFRKAIRGDLGQSLVIQGQDITPLVLRELTVSMELGGAALLITIGVGVSFGVLAALRQNTWVDYTLTTVAVIGYSVPSFVIATVMLLFFGIYLDDWTGGAISYPIGWTGTYGTLAELSVPAIALGFYTSGQVTRITRAAMLDVLQQDYIRTARAKGLSTQLVTIRHALRNALVPVVSILGPLVVTIITGAVVIENIFGIPGLGKEFVESITRHDYNVTVGVFTILVVLIGLANLAVDLLYTVIDPRIRY